MENKIVIMDFSGVYGEQNFFREENCPGAEAEILDFKDLQGTNCYCDAQAMEEIRKRIQDCPAEGMHFIDSGNYHYLSRIWIEKIREPFALLVFDNHTDMQPPAFGGLLSCGGWIAAALEECPLLKQVILIGPDEAAYEQVEENLKDRVRFLSREVLAEKDLGWKMEWLENALENSSELPLYISVDKDVLCPEDASTSWSQGDMKLTELTALLKTALGSEVTSTRAIIGMDICGECDAPGESGGEKNERANAALLELWKNWRNTHEI